MYKNKEQQKQYQREWIAKRRDEFFLDKKCSKCDSVTDLELHHLDPLKKISHRIWSWSEERRSTELQKCTILCNACHKDETAKQRLEGVTCGSRTMYNKGCRCSLCRAAVAAQMRVYRGILLVG